MADTEFLRETRVSRSAYAVQTARDTAIYLGTCEEHQRPVRFDATADSAAVRFRQIPCPETGHLIRAERLVAVTTNLECDGACRSARRAACSCGCGGVNHGNTWTAGYQISNTRVFASELEKYRAEIRKVREKRDQQRQQAERRERVQFDAWAADHQEVIAALAPYRHSEENGFLRDLATQVTDGWNGKPKPLTEGQERAALRVISETARRAQQQAELQAAARPCPVGKVQISGQIVKITSREGYMPGTAELKATVACDGYKIWVSLPRALENWASENRHKELWQDWRPTSGPDYDGATARWTRALRGMQISFTAQVERSDRDESFGFAKRPTRVSFEVPQPEPEIEQMEAC